MNKAGAANDIPLLDREPAQAVPLMMVFAGLLASVFILYILTREPILVAAYGAGLLSLGGIAVFFITRQINKVSSVALFSQPDWSVTVTAIDRPDAAIAITDRQGTLVCANIRFTTWFGETVTPSSMPLDGASQERLDRVERECWRDGKARTEPVTNGMGRWHVEAERAGRGEDYVVWRFVSENLINPLEEIARQIEGKVGRILAQSGFAAAIIDSDGLIRVASTGFAKLAVGDERASLTGQDFVSLLRTDDNECLTWVREGANGTPLTLYYIPIADPDSALSIDPALTPSLMLVVDANAGIGRREGDGAAAIPNLEALLEQLPLGLAMADRDGRLLFANPAFMRAAGREGELPPVYPTDLVVMEDKNVLSDTIRRYAKGAQAAGDLTVRLVAQPEESVSLSLAGVRGLGDAAVLVGLTDSSEEMRLRRQVAQATKMQAVGQLAGGVAHDFNNVLTAILGTCDLMLLRHTPGDSDYDDIQQIRANSNRAASLTRQLLAFSRQQTLRPEVLQLPDIVADITQMLKRLIGEKIQLVVEHDRDLSPVRADPTQMEQVIVNLAVNARDAMQSHGDGSGNLTVSTRRVMISEVRNMRSEIIPSGEYTALIVHDTGGGISPENLGKIFEPFFTTKEQGKGTGLGLSTVYGIVKQSGGYIVADSEVGVGTTFAVYLPAHRAEPSVSPVSRASFEPKPLIMGSTWACEGHILLVEDEDPVRMVAERALLRSGYTVVTARDGEEGLEHVEAGNRFDIVVSDVVMPSMDGPAMVREIRAHYPDIPVLFMSGYAEDHLRRQINMEQVYFLPKPFSVQEISDKVSSILREQSAKV